MKKSLPKSDQGKSLKIGQIQYGRLQQNQKWKTVIDIEPIKINPCVMGLFILACTDECNEMQFLHFLDQGPKIQNGRPLFMKITKLSYQYY